MNEEIESVLQSKGIAPTAMHIGFGVPAKANSCSKFG